MGKYGSVSEKSVLQRPETVKRGRPRSWWVRSPSAPKEKIIAIAVVNGGEISGRSVVASSTATHARGRFARAAVKAKRKPSPVPASPTSVPRRRLLPRARRLFGSRRIATSGPSAGRPPSRNTRPSSAPSGKITNRTRSAHSRTTVTRSAGSRRSVSLLEIEDLVHPALDDALAVGARVGVVDRKDPGAPEHLGQARLDRHLGVGRNEVDLVRSVQALHRGRRRPVDQLPAELRLLRPLDHPHRLPPP